MSSRVHSLTERWRSLGIYVHGEVDPLENPELLISETCERYEEDGRLLGFAATWLSIFHPLVIIRKIRLRTDKARGVFAALLTEARADPKRFHKWLSQRRLGDEEPVYTNLSETETEWARHHPNASFRRYGLLLAQSPRSSLIRPKILYPVDRVLEESAILRMRALYGASIRSDLVAVLPRLGPISMHGLAQRLGVAHPSIFPMIQDLARWKQVQRVQSDDRFGRLVWIG
jgi:hypothetical protein